MTNKLRTWDSKILSDTYVVLQQIQAGIEEITTKVGAHSLADLPNSMIPTENLYAITLCYEAMYDKLLEYDLLVTGNKKPSSTIH
jgi:hypothetical protein